MKPNYVTLSRNDLCYISASLNNMALDYAEWATGECKDVAKDYLESSRKSRKLCDTFNQIIKDFDEEYAVTMIYYK